MESISANWIEVVWRAWTEPRAGGLNENHTHGGCHALPVASRAAASMVCDTSKPNALLVYDQMYFFEQYDLCPPLPHPIPKTP
jgi:hypothetical protein